MKFLFRIIENIKQFFNNVEKKHDQHYEIKSVDQLYRENYEMLEKLSKRNNK